MRRLLFLIIIIFVSVVAGYLSWRVFWVKPIPEAAVVLFEIKEGESLAEISPRLFEKKIISSPRLFQRYLAWKNLDTKIQSGIFELKPNLSIRSLVEILTNPESAEIQLTFIEGQNLRDYGHYLEYNGVAMAEELQELVGFPAIDYRWTKEMPAPKDFSSQFDFLKDKPKYVSLEGYLFPDTYRFKKTAGVEEIAKKLLENFGRKLTPALRLEISQQNKTIFEVVTMASLIEAEAKTEADRRLVSDILWRRLSVGMPLQVDSSVNYVTGKKKSAISSVEQTIDSLYNTYKYPGLPLGPINNPSLSSILAAIYPEKNDDWFFLSDQQGKMHYARTLTEHNRLKESYLK